MNTELSPGQQQFREKQLSRIERAAADLPKGYKLDMKYTASWVPVLTEDGTATNVYFNSRTPYEKVSWVLPKEYYEEAEYYPTLQEALARARYLNGDKMT